MRTRGFCDGDSTLRTTVFDLLELDAVEFGKVRDEGLLADDREEETKGFGGRITHFRCCIVEAFEEECRERLHERQRFGREDLSADLVGELKDTTDHLVHCSPYLGDFVVGDGVEALDEVRQEGLGLSQEMVKGRLDGRGDKGLLFLESLEERKETADAVLLVVETQTTGKGSNALSSLGDDHDVHIFGDGILEHRGDGAVVAISPEFWS